MSEIIPSKYVEKASIYLSDLFRLGPGVFKRRLPSKTECIQIKTRFGRYFIRKNDSDMNVLRQVFVDKEYDINPFLEGKVKRCYDAILSTGRVPVIIDAGSNIGASSRYFAASYPKAKIFAVEPDPGSAAICKLNTANIEKIEVVEAAIGSQEGFVSVERCAGNSWATRTRRAAQGSLVVTVPQLLARVPDGELYIVKIDIEGFEDDLFSCNTEWVSGATAIIVEPHDWLLPGRRTSQHLQKTMASQNRDIFISGENLVWI